MGSVSMVESAVAQTPHRKYQYQPATVEHTSRRTHVDDRRHQNTRLLDKILYNAQWPFACL